MNPQQDQTVQSMQLSQEAQNLLGDLGNYSRISPVEYTPSKWTYAGSGGALLCWDRSNFITLISLKSSALVFRIPVTDISQYDFNTYNGRLHLKSGKVYYLTFNPETRALAQASTAADVAWQAMPGEALKVGVMLGISEEQQRLNEEKAVLSQSSDRDWWTHQFSTQGIKIGLTGRQSVLKYVIVAVIILAVIGVVALTSS